MLNDRVKGYAFAVVGTIAFSNTYIFSKAALNEVHLVQFGLYWFFIAFVLNALWLLKTGHHRKIFQLTSRQIKALLLLGVLEAFTTATFFLSIQIIPDPAVTSFIGNLYPVFLMIMGIVLLKERFVWLESVGAILAIGGAFVVSFQGGSSLSDIFIPGAGVVLLNALFASTASIVVKKNVKDLSPELVNTNRSFWLVLVSIVAMQIVHKPLEIPMSAFVNITIGSVFGPFLSILLIYYSFKLIEVSKSSVIQSLKGIFVLLGSFLYFNTFPLPHQVIGGVITVAGVLIISLAKVRFLNGKK